MVDREIKDIKFLKKEQNGHIILIESGYMSSENPSADVETLYRELGNYHAEELKGLLSKLDNRKVILYSDILSNLTLANVIDYLPEDDWRIVVDVANAGNEHIVMKLLAGDGDEIKINGLYTPSSIDNIMKQRGMRTSCVADIHETDSQEDVYSYLTSEKTVLSEYIKHVKNVLDKDAGVCRIIRCYEKNDITRDEESSDGCFLSIVMRTQGKRKTELEEALLSVYGQTNQDYELLLIGHNLDDEGRINVDRIISQTPKELRDKIRYIAVNGGTRTTPLIKGFEEARGKYVAILDDDDVVFDNWIEVFSTLAEDDCGKILHAYCAKQEWIKIKNPYGGEALRAISGFEKIYCRDFSELEQLNNNTCPIHSLAFPRSAYTKLGIRFDEKLNVVEDWDFLMRMSFYTGVKNAGEITSIYRVWKNTENSAALHEQKEWDDTRESIIGKFDANPIVMPSGIAGKVVKLLNDGITSAMSKGGPKLWTFFVAVEEHVGFTPERMIPEYVNVAKTGEFKVEYRNLDRFGNVNAVRLDPSEEGFIMVSDVRVQLFYTDNTSEIVREYETNKNCIKIKNKSFFYDIDPQIIVETKKKYITGVKITGILSYELDSDAKEYLVKLIERHDKKKKKLKKHERANKR